MAIIKGVHTLDLRALRNLNVADGDVSIAEVNLTAEALGDTIMLERIGFAGAGATITGEQSWDGTQKTALYPLIFIVFSTSDGRTGISYVPTKYESSTENVTSAANFENGIFAFTINFGDGKEFDDKFVGYFNTVFPLATGIKGSFQLNTYDFSNIELLYDGDIGLVMSNIPDDICAFANDNINIQLLISGTSYPSLADFNAANITISEVIYQPTNAIEFLRKNSSTLEFVSQKFIEPTDDVEQPATLAMLKAVKDEMAGDEVVEIEYTVTDLSTLNVPGEATDEVLGGNVSKMFSILESGKDVKFNLIIPESGTLISMVFKHDSVMDLSLGSESIKAYGTDSKTWVLFYLLDIYLVKIAGENNNEYAMRSMASVSSMSAETIDNTVVGIRLTEDGYDEQIAFSTDRLGMGTITEIPITIRSLKTITLSLDQADGIAATLPSGSQTSYSINMDFSFARASLTLPTPTKEGFVFKGWYTTKTPTAVNGAFTDITPVSGDMTLYAVFEKPSVVQSGSVLTLE